MRAKHGLSPTSSDAEILDAAEKLFRNEKVLEAYRLLQTVPKKATVRNDERYRSMCRIAHECEEGIGDLRQEPNETWKKQGESHGSNHPSLIYYKLDDSGSNSSSKLTCRCETPIEQDLLIPLLSVLNESSLYGEWIPSYKVPKLGIKSCQQLALEQRANQVIQIIMHVPWPFAPREAIVSTVVVDEIDEHGYFAVRLHTKANSKHVPCESPSVLRTNLEGTLLFRPCPRDHAILLKSGKTSGEPMILVSFKMWTDPNMQGVPTSLLNFVTRTAIGDIWGMLLAVAESVKQGERPRHSQAVSSKPELYQFVQARIAAMLEKMEEAEQWRFIAYLQS